MRILFFIHSLLSGGAERVLVVIANELLKRGYEITIAYDFNRPVQYELLPQIKCIDIMGCQIRGKGLISQIIKGILLMLNIRKISNHVNPNVVIAFMTGMNRYVIPALAFTNVPVIVSEHLTLNETAFPVSIFNHLTRRFTYKWADKITVLTPYDKDCIGNRLNNVVVVPNPLTFTPISEDLFNRIDGQRKNILACGRIDRYAIKGFDSLILYYSKIVDKGVECDLDILGDGDEDSFCFLKNLITENHLEERVHLLGYHTDVKEVMLQHKYFILSSKSEGFPMALLEAMATGCACISFDCVAGPRSIIDNDIDGILVEDQNFEMLIDTLYELVTDDMKRKRIAYNAINNVKRFSVSNIVDRWEELLTHL